MSRLIGDILPPKPEVSPRIYAWSPDDPPAAYVGLIKVGQTAQADVNDRIRQSQGQMQQTYTLHVDSSAVREADGSIFRDTDVRRRLVEKKFENVLIGSSREWMRCSPDDVRVAVVELQKGLRFDRARHEDFPPRQEQQDAVDATHAYFQSRWAEDATSVPRFLWNAKMRFGKTFTSYRLAQTMGATKVLVVTFKPAVEDAWQADLESHVDFEGWQYLSRASGRDPRDADPDRPLVYFGSFQDLLGREAGTGAIKPKNEWLHTTDWDLVIFDEYHFGAWRDTARELFEGETDARAAKGEYSPDLEQVNEDLEVLSEVEAEFLPITTRSYLYLSGTPFKALATGEFIEEQIFNWTYTDEQHAKAEFAKAHPSERNPYAALPEMRLLTYQMPQELLAIASSGEFNEFDLNAFFAASGTGTEATFTHKDDVQKWLQVIRGEHAPEEALKSGSRPPWPYAQAQLLPWLNHALWFLPSVAACEAMRNLVAEPQNRSFWGDYRVVMAAGPTAGLGLQAVGPVRAAIGEGYKTKTITLSCGKLTTGVTIKEWSSILMLRNLKSPETYFQAAFRVQSPWSIKNPDGDDPNREDIVKPVCFVFDFAPTRALRQVWQYGAGLSPGESNLEKAVADLVSFLPVLAYADGKMVAVNAGEILDIAMAGTSGTLLARKWESALLVNVDDATLKKVLADEEAMKVVGRIEGWRALGDNVIETIIARSDAVKDLKKKARDGAISQGEEAAHRRGEGIQVPA